MEIASKLDYNYMEFLHPPGTKEINSRQRSPCRIAIITMGSLNELSFSNCPHVDEKEAYLPELQEKLLKDLRFRLEVLMKKSEPLFKNNRQSIIKFQNYVNLCARMLKLGVPTTCCYQHLLNSPEYTLMQDFVMEGLSCSVPIEDYTSHHFYSHAFTHNTSLCLAVNKQGRVFVTNQNTKLALFLPEGTGAIMLTLLLQVHLYLSIQEMFQEEAKVKLEEDPLEEGDQQGSPGRTSLQSSKTRISPR